MSESETKVGWVQIRIPEEQTEQAKRLSQVILREPFQKRSWAELGYFLASSALVGAGVLVLGALGIAGLFLTVVFVGVLILAGDLRAARGFGHWQRVLAHRILGEDIAEPEPLNARPGFFSWLRASLTDGAAWRAVAYFVAKVPLTLFGVWFALSVWIEAFFGNTSPLTGSIGPDPFGPRKPVTIPDGTSKVRLSTAVAAPYRLVSECVVIITDNGTGRPRSVEYR